MATRRKKAARKPLLRKKRPGAKKSVKIKLRIKPRKHVARAVHVTRKLTKTAMHRKKVQRKAVKVAKVAVKRRSSAVVAHTKMLENHHVRNLLTEIAGEKALKVVGEMTVPMSDEALAGEAKMKLSETRAVLNKLHAAGIAYYDRTRNNEGWYTYTWNVSLDKAKRIVGERVSVEKSAVEAVSNETGEFYICPTCHERSKARLRFEEAVEAEFKCPECLGMLQYAGKK